jgi:hypothetical protein
MANNSKMPEQQEFSQRETPMRVICPALSRNGTDSMRKALETLGIGRTFHGFRLGERPECMDSWMDLVERKYPRSNHPRDVKPISTADFDRVIGDCGAVTDMPCAAFWRELMAAYPDAKVVLVERDVESWFRSFNLVVINGMMSLKGQLFANPLVAAFTGDRKIEMMFRVFLKYFHANNRDELARNARQIYIDHNSAIREVCRQEGRPILCYKLGDGWQPLCDFLEVDVPADLEFPSGNEAQSLYKFTHTIQRQRVFKLVGMIASRVIIVAGALGVAAIAWNNPQLMRDSFGSFLGYA